MNNAPAKVQPAEIIPPQEELVKLAPPDLQNRDWFATMVRESLIRQFQRNPKLMECSQISLYTSICDGVRIGLDPSGSDDQAYLVPYRGEARLQIGYQGLTQLLYDNAHVKFVFSEIVMKTDKFEYRPGNWPVHEPDLDCERTMENLRGAYAVVELNTSEHPITRWCNKAEIEKARKCSQYQGKDTPAWRDWPTSMARKVPILRIYKQCPRTARMSHALKIEAQQHQEADNAAEEPSGTRTEQLTQALGLGVEPAGMAETERANYDALVSIWQNHAPESVQKAMDKIGASQVSDVPDDKVLQLIDWLEQKHADLAPAVKSEYEARDE